MTTDIIRGARRPPRYSIRKEIQGDIATAGSGVAEVLRLSYAMIRSRRCLRRSQSGMTDSWSS